MSTGQTSVAVFLRFPVLALILGILLFTSWLALASSVQGQEGIPIACIQFTEDGQPIGDRICNTDANDIEIWFGGRARLQFTKDGEKLGDPIGSPNGAHRFKAKWDDLRGVITEGSWGVGTHDQPVPVPEGANDFKLVAQKITKVW
ncbi:MAG: hypothetical protein FJ320_05855 [SAR202 cluster bacterium]|nr:hypothetical protein [SAR202 cluster bacterium]